MHVRKSLVVRNPLRPVPERLPCKLTAEEERALVKKAFALERTAEELEAKALAEKAKSKAKISELAEERSRVMTEKRQAREEVLRGETVRQVDCLLLEDLEEGAIYVFRQDTGEVVQRRDMRPEELAERRQQNLPLEEVVTRTVDIPEGVEKVKRFDSDPPSAGEDEPEEGDDWTRSDDRTADLLGLIGRGDIEFSAIEGWTDEQIRAVDAWASAVQLLDQGADWPDAPACVPEPEVEAEESPKPTRRKRGEGKRAKGYDTRVGTH